MDDVTVTPTTVGNWWDCWECNAALPEGYTYPVCETCLADRQRREAASCRDEERRRRNGGILLTGGPGLARRGEAIDGIEI
jgi:hypothetical protein